MSKRHFNKTEAKRILEGQSLKRALDTLAPITTQREIENSAQHATEHPYWHPKDFDHRAQLLNLLRETIDIIKTELQTISRK